MQLTRLADAYVLNVLESGGFGGSLQVLGVCCVECIFASKE
jgi:hypothetical protein